MWKKWNDVMRDQLVNSQIKTGHASGSWDAIDAHGRGPGGRLYTTCMATMTLDYADRDAVIESRVGQFRSLAGSRHPYDEAAQRAVFTREFDRTVDFSHTNNHAGAVGSTMPWQSRLEGLDVPTLVVHGDEDPMLQYPHGVRIAELIPGATLLTLKGVGHEMPRDAWPTIVSRLIRHTDQSN